MYIWINAIFNFHALRCDRAVQAQPIHLSSLETATISLNRAPACCLLSGGESSTGGAPNTISFQQFTDCVWNSSPVGECKITLFSCFVALFLSR